MTATGIEWCDYSSNLLKYRDADGKSVWACAKVSPGCAHCYAETLAHRYGKGGPFTLKQVGTVTPYFDHVEAKRIRTSRKLAGRRVFIDDMTDLFGDWVPDEIIDQHFGVFAARQDVTFQVLTKRPERMAAYCGDETFVPLPNVWLGASVEDQARADERIPHLLDTPATVRFLSVEPLLGPVDLLACRYQSTTHKGVTSRALSGRLYGGTKMDAISWIIVGGESGPGRRPMDLTWARSIRDQCKAAGVAFFMKQVDKKIPIPADLFVREFPS